MFSADLQADGWIARRFPSQSSLLGSFLDPLADKLLVGSVAVTLAIKGTVNRKQVLTISLTFSLILPLSPGSSSSALCLGPSLILFLLLFLCVVALILSRFFFSSVFYLLSALNHRSLSSLFPLLLCLLSCLLSCLRVAVRFFPVSSSPRFFLLALFFQALFSFSKREGIILYTTTHN